MTSAEKSLSPTMKFVALRHTTTDGSRNNRLVSRCDSEPAGNDLSVVESLYVHKIMHCHRIVAGEPGMS